jgi:hypothetical protein
MPDLRTLTDGQRRSLIAKARKLAQDGVAAMEIRAQLGISQATYSRWAKRFGFRACDLRVSGAEEVMDLNKADAVLMAVRDALAHGEQGRADQLLRAWKQTARRTRDLTALENAAAREAEESQSEVVLSNEELSAFLTKYAGRTIEVVD